MVFVQSGHRDAHLRTHTRARPYACTAKDCKKTFSQSGNRDRHAKTHEKTASTTTDETVCETKDYDEIDENDEIDEIVWGEVDDDREITTRLESILEVMGGEVCAPLPMSAFDSAARYPQPLHESLRLD